MKKQVTRLLIIGILFGMSQLSMGATGTKQAVQSVYKEWCDAIGTAKGDGKRIAAFYAENATLLPTLSAKKIATQPDLIKYFDHLTSKPNIHCTPKKLHTIIHSDVATNTGFYDFSFTAADGKTTVLPARFTFIYKKTGDQWLIINHHSSAMPQ